MLKLKEHLLPRVKEALLQENILSQDKIGHGLPPSHQSIEELTDNRPELDSDAANGILFKNDRIYKHRLIQFNYTTYDVRRAQDVVNPGTTHCNVMFLSDMGDDTPEASRASNFHPFRYARVIGIYHVNVIYVGSGMMDYNSRRFDFLWVRWYQGPIPRSGDLNRLDTWRLDQLSFFPVNDPRAFGFVDPADVLRGCHIIPRFSEGQRRKDSSTLSKCARDHGDWNSYYAARCVNCPLSHFMVALMLGSFVDRDMLIRYHWGLGVGHSYAWEHKQKETVSTAEPEPFFRDVERTSEQDFDDLPEEHDVGGVIGGSLSRDVESESDSDTAGDNPELCMEDRENEDLGESSGNDSYESSSDGEDSDT